MGQYLEKIKFISSVLLKLISLGSQSSDEKTLTVSHNLINTATQVTECHGMSDGEQAIKD